MNVIPPVLTAVLLTAIGTHAESSTAILADELLQEEQYPLAAVEFRRFAMETETSSDQAAAYLYAGYAYLRAGQSEFSSEMIDRAESADAASQFADDITFLNAEIARDTRDLDTALYYYDVLAADTAHEAERIFALRRAAAVHLSRGDLALAVQKLQQLDDPAAQAALETYAAGHDKSPVVGGLLGLIPGMGYWYSGEVANGFRSLILNSLFIYGMVDTAQDDQWGAFAIITFFQITWYSGSIYGGIDAAHRYNQDRLDTAIQGIESDMKYRPDPTVTVPLFRLNIEF